MAWYGWILLAAALGSAGSLWWCLNRDKDGPRGCIHCGACIAAGECVLVKKAKKEDRLS